MRLKYKIKGTFIVNISLSSDQSVLTNLFWPVFSDQSVLTSPFFLVKLMGSGLWRTLCIECPDLTSLWHYCCVRGALNVSLLPSGPLRAPNWKSDVSISWVLVSSSAHPDEVEEKIHMPSPAPFLLFQLLTFNSNWIKLRLQRTKVLANNPSFSLYQSSKLIIMRLQVEIQKFLICWKGKPTVFRNLTGLSYGRSYPFRRIYF